MKIPPIAPDVKRLYWTQKNKNPQFLEGNCGFYWMLLDFLKHVGGGERGIRTPGRLLTYTRFPGVRLKPLIHLSGNQ